MRILRNWKTRELATQIRPQLSGNFGTIGAGAIPSPANQEFPCRRKSSRSMVRSFGNKRQRARPWIALGVAYLLAFQAIMFSLAAGAMAGSVGSAISDICSSQGETAGHDGSGQQPRHTHLPPCCMPGCTMFGASAAPSPDAPSLVVPRISAHAAIRPFARDRIDIRRAQTLRSPRGPPLA